MQLRGASQLDLGCTRVSSISALGVLRTAMFQLPVASTTLKSVFPVAEHRCCIFYGAIRISCTRPRTVFSLLSLSECRSTLLIFRCCILVLKHLLHFHSFRCDSCRFVALAFLPSTDYNYVPFFFFFFTLGFGDGTSAISMEPPAASASTPPPCSIFVFASRKNITSRS